MYYYHIAELLRWCNKRMLNNETRKIRKQVLAWIFRAKQMTLTSIGGVTWG